MASLLSNKVCTVRLVKKENVNQILDTHNFDTVNFKLPVIQIQRHFGLRNLVWADMDVDIEADSNGLSTLSFSGIKFISVYGAPAR